MRKTFLPVLYVKVICKVTLSFTVYIPFFSGLCQVRNFCRSQNEILKLSI